MRRLLIAPLLLAAVGCTTDVPPTSFALPPEMPAEVTATPALPPSEPQVLVTRGRTVKPRTVDAVTVFPYEDGKVYPVAVSPGYLTALLLEPGEQMPGKAAIGDPDPARWLVEKTTAGSPKGPVVALLIKPGAPGIATNVFIPTNRRTYQLDVTSSTRRAMDMVRWTYPERGTANPELAPAEAPFDPATINRDYRIDVVEGDRPRWTPVAAFDVGSRSYVEFPANIGQVSAPALFVLDEGGLAIPAPFRPRGRFYEIDRTFSAAELRQGETVVRITRSAG
ncbi:MAG: TrbG/VirB9 family P-type conjugative transfer protein [Rhodospirillales bacterium]